MTAIDAAEAWIEAWLDCQCGARYQSAYRLSGSAVSRFEARNPCPDCGGVHRIYCAEPLVRRVPRLPEFEEPCQKPQDAVSNASAAAENSGDFDIINIMRQEEKPADQPAPAPAPLVDHLPAPKPKPLAPRQLGLGL